jgi:hypothetical protein
LLVDRAGVGVISDARLFVAALSSSSPFALVVSNLLVCCRIVRLLGVCGWLSP